MSRLAAPPLAAAALLACLVLPAQAADLPAQAAPPSGKGEYLGAWSFSASGGRAAPGAGRYEGGPAWRLAAGYSPHPQFGVELEYGRFPGAVSGGGQGEIPDDDLAAGDLDVRGLSLSAVARLPLAGLPAMLFALGGVGHYAVAYTMGDEARSRYESSGAKGLPDQAVGDAWGIHAGIGAEYVLGAHLSLVAELRHLFLSPAVSGHTTPGHRLDDSLDLGTLAVTGGVKAVF